MLPALNAELTQTDTTHDRLSTVFHSTPEPALFAVSHAIQPSQTWFFETSRNLGPGTLRCRQLHKPSTQSLLLCLGFISWQHLRLDHIRMSSGFVTVHIHCYFIVLLTLEELFFQKRFKRQSKNGIGIARSLSGIALNAFWKRAFHKVQVALLS